MPPNKVSVYEKVSQINWGLMNILAIIPARGGSKGFPGKNLTTIGGRSLLARTADCVKDSAYKVRGVLSTDNEEIALVGQSLGLEVPFQRPEELASDEATTLSVIQHAVAWLYDEEGYQPEWVIILQPTSPLRRAEHLDAALKLLIEGGGDSLISLTPMTQHPKLAFEVVNGQARKLHGSHPSRRQELDTLYYPNGAIYITNPMLLAEELLLGDEPTAFIMPPWESVDVDNPWDIAVAEAAMLYQPDELEHQEDE